MIVNKQDIYYPQKNGYPFREKWVLYFGKMGTHFICNWVPIFELNSTIWN